MLFFAILHRPRVHVGNNYTVALCHSPSPSDHLSDSLDIDPLSIDFAHVNNLVPTTLHL